MNLKTEYKFTKKKRKDVTSIKKQHLSRLEDIREQGADSQTESRCAQIERVSPICQADSFPLSCLGSLY